MKFYMKREDLGEPYGTPTGFTLVDTIEIPMEDDYFSTEYIYLNEATELYCGFGLIWSEDWDNEGEDEEVFLGRSFVKNGVQYVELEEVYKKPTITYEWKVMDE